MTDGVTVLFGTGAGDSRTRGGPAPTHAAVRPERDPAPIRASAHPSRRPRRGVDEQARVVLSIDPDEGVGMKCRRTWIVMASLALALVTAVSAVGEECCLFQVGGSLEDFPSDWIVRTELDANYSTVTVEPRSGLLSINYGRLVIVAPHGLSRLVIQGLSGHTIVMEINGEVSRSSRFHSLPPFVHVAMEHLGGQIDGDGENRWAFTPVDPTRKIVTFSIAGVEVYLSEICVNI